MNTSAYVTEQLARYSRQEREAATAASRAAREARTSRRQCTSHTAGAAMQTTTAPGTVRIPRQRRWIDAVHASVR